MPDVSPEVYYAILARDEELRKYNEKHPHRYFKYQSRSYKREQRFTHNMRNRMRAALSGKKRSADTEDLIGCSFEELRGHIEEQFLPGMTWRNHSPRGWHVDHIRPIASFDLTDPLQQRQCFHFSNLRPMWAAQNMSKGKKVGTDAEPVPLVTIGSGGDFMHDRSRRQVIVYKRTSGVKRGTYYAGFLDADTGLYRVRKVIYDADGRPVTSRAIAEELARDMASDIVLVVRDEKIKTYLSAFWDRDGKYAKSAEARGRPLSLKYMENSQSLLRVWVFPFLKEANKEDIGMAHIAPALLEDLMMWAQGKGASPRNINAMRQAVTVPLSYYWRLKGHPEKNPSPSVTKFAERRMEREILTPDEARKFFALPWSDKRVSTINLLAATTGMRLGECLGLQVEDLHGDWLRVCHNWQDREGIKGPKGSTVVRIRARNVPIPRVTRKALESLAKDSARRGSAFVFYGAQPSRPLGGKIVQAGYASAMGSIGIDDDGRKRRGLNFHSWRHWYNSMLRGRVDDHALRALTGHSSEAMTQRYTEITDGQRKAVRKVAEGLVTKKKRIARLK